MFTDKAWNENIHTEYPPDDPRVTVSWTTADRYNDLAFTHSGARVCLYSGDSQLLFEDIKLAQPSILSSTPRLYNIVYNEYKKVLSLAEVKVSVVKQAN